ncbi:hypothetical protein D5b_00151 [Faustovirus]|nr:hypothetical protein D5b_00151 [Faustovirus]AMN84760.1 hypothetical protein D6_00360 [Faustovirus]AMP44108.1 hypothetical protein PRJ_Dakar_00149 [Faustovirus]
MSDPDFHLTPPEYDPCDEFIRVAKANKHNISHAIKPDTGIEKWFIEYCKSAKPSDIVMLLAGFKASSNDEYDLPPSCISAATVNKILTHHKDDHKYVHALCPFVYDRWNLGGIGGSTGSVVECYWRNLGDLNYKPQPNEFTKITLSALCGGIEFSLQQTKITKDDGILCALRICGDYIVNRGGTMNGYWCTNCRNLFHTKCFNDINKEDLPCKYNGAGKHIYSCPCCHIEWNIGASTNNKGYHKW